MQESDYAIQKKESFVKITKWWDIYVMQPKVKIRKKERKGNTHPSNYISVNDRNVMGLEKIWDSTLSRRDSTCQSHYPHFHSLYFRIVTDLPVLMPAQIGRYM